MASTDIVCCIWYHSMVSLSTVYGMHTSSSKIQPNTLKNNKNWPSCFWTQISDRPIISKLMFQCKSKQCLTEVCYFSVWECARERVEERRCERMGGGKGEGKSNLYISAHSAASSVLCGSECDEPTSSGWAALSVSLHLFHHIKHFTCSSGSQLSTVLYTWPQKNVHTRRRM